MVHWLQDDGLICILDCYVTHTYNSDNRCKIKINMGNCLFWKLLNEALSEVIGREDYRFDPKTIMVDENVANFYGLKEEFGLDFVMSKTVSCQMCFKNNINKSSLLDLGVVSKMYAKNYVVRCAQ